MGHAVQDFFTHRKNRNIQVESDIAEDDVIPSEYLFRGRSEMPDIELKALGLCRGKVLDVGACAGTHSLLLQSEGLDVTALEISELCCDVMRQRGVKQVVADNFYYFDKGTFDTLLFLMNGIGIAGTVAGLENLLKKAYALLNDGGILVFDSSDVDYMYYDEDGSKLINLNSSYHGELNYRMHFRKISGEMFPWLFIDFDTLVPIAKTFGFNCKLIQNGTHFEYLAVLEKQSK